MTVAQTEAKTAAFRQEIRRRVIAAGRDPDAVKVSLGMLVLTGETGATARKREHRLYQTIAMWVLEKAARSGRMIDGHAPPLSGPGRLPGPHPSGHGD